MVPFEMPLDAKLALAKMSVIYEREMGSKIRMSRDEDIVSLINFAVDSINEEIIKYLHTFTTLMAPSELRQLAAQGANIYRGAVVPSVDVTAEELREPITPGVQMYRGRPIGGSAGSESSATPAAPAEENSEEKKPKRVYRGRVIDD